MSVWLQLRLGTSPLTGYNPVPLWDAVVLANSVCRVQPRNFARSRAGAPREPQTLSVPVEGGVRSLQTTAKVETALISGHGNWPHVHLGAIDAIYGRSPYFRHVFPEIERILSNPPSLLGDLNRSLLTSVLELTGLYGDGDVESLRSSISEAAISRGAELKVKVCPELSVLDAVMCLGPETVLALL